MAAFGIKSVLWLLLAQVTACFVNSRTTMLPNLRLYNEKGTDPSVNRTRSNNVDFLDHEGISLCHIVDLLFHSVTAPDGERMSVPGGISEVATAAIALAAEHLNAGNGTVIPELEGLNERCNVRFSTEFMDTEISPAVTVNKIIEANDRETRRPCAFLGAGASTVSMVSSTITGLMDYPQLSWLSASSKLSDAEQFPLFARLTSPIEAYPRSLMELLYHKLGVRHLAVLHTDNPGRLDAIIGLQNVAKNHFPAMVVQPFPFAGRLTETSAQVVLENIRRSKLTYIYASVDREDSGLLMKESVKAGLAGTSEHVWILPVYDHSFLAEDFEDGDPTLLALRGAMRLEPTLGYPGVARYNAFEAAWNELGGYDADMEYLLSMVPKYPNSSLYQPTLDKANFEQVGPYLSRAYDAAVLLGLAACGTSTMNFTGQQLFASMFNISFEGVTGVVALDPSTRARTTNGAMFRLLNVVQNESNDGNKTLSEVEVAFYNGMRWNFSSRITFNNGTTIVPSDLPPVRENYNFVPTYLRNLGMCMAGAILLCSICMSMWTTLCKSKSRVIQAAQPLFLHLICVGVMMLGLSIIPLTLTDGSRGDAIANNACMIFPWLLALGWCVSFSALFSKTMRVNILFHNPTCQRLKVTPFDVARPMAVLLTCKGLSDFAT